MRLVLFLALVSTAFAQEPPVPPPGEPAPTTAPADPAAPAPTTPATTAPPAEPAVVAIVRDPKEIQFFKDAQARFAERAKELEADTRAFIDQREKEEHDKLATGYDSVINDLDGEVDERRGLAIERFEQFLQRYPSVPYASHVRFRLADLYWEDARESWLKRSQDYYIAEEEAIANGTTDTLPEPPMMDLSGPVALYERIILDNATLARAEQYEFLDGTYYSLGFVYREENSAQYDEERARFQFTELIRVRPESLLADDAHLNLGNFAFEESDFDGAIAEYKFIYDKGPVSRLYPDALYQLAWAYYKLDIYSPDCCAPPRPTDPADFTALMLFTKLLDFSEKSLADTGKKSDYAPDAIKFMAFSFADMAEKNNPEHLPTGMNPVGAAQAWFAKVGPREYEWDVYVALAQALMDYNRFGEAISVYEVLQKDERWKNRPENPEFQMQVVKLHASNDDLASSAASRIALTERYNDTTEWWKANRYNPEALGKARGFIEESLSDVAREYLIAAESTGDPARYTEAAAKFREYLDKFPMSDDYYENQWFLAYTLYRSGSLPEAIREYESLMKSKAHHKYGDGSIVQILQARLSMLETKYGDLQVLEADAVVERTYTSPWKPDAPIDVYAYQTEQKEFIAAADLLLTWKFTPPTDPKDPDFAEFVLQNYGKLTYLPAQIAQVHQRFDESRPRLLAMLLDPQLRCTDEGLYAAKYIVDSYVLEGNISEVRKYTKQFLDSPPGPDGCRGIKDPDIANQYEASRFKECSARADIGDTDGAAECFLGFMKEFPASTNRKDALYNVANQYDKGGKVELANRYYEQFVDENPKDEESANLYFRIAANNEEIFELGKSVDFYGRLMKNFPEHSLAADAAYNVAFLRVGLGDHKNAAIGFEDYARKYPTKEDAGDVLWRAGEQWELVSPASAITFYEKYRREHGAEDPNRLLECDMRIAAMYEKQKNPKKVLEYQDLTLKDWEQIEQSGRTGEVKLEGRNAAAESGFRSVIAAYDILVREKALPKDQQKAAELLKTKEAAVLAFRGESVTQVGRFQDLEYSTAIFYMNAKALLYYVELGYQLSECPTEYSEDECTAYLEILEEQVVPLFQAYQDKVKTEFEDLIKFAHEKKFWSDWVTKAQEDLYALDPFKYSLEKVEAKGAVDSSIPTIVAPLPIEKKKLSLPGETTTP